MLELALSSINNENAAEKIVQEVNSMPAVSEEVRIILCVGYLFSTMSYRLLKQMLSNSTMIVTKIKILIQMKNYATLQILVRKI